MNPKNATPLRILTQGLAPRVLVLAGIIWGALSSQADAVSCEKPQDLDSYRSSYGRHMVLAKILPALKQGQICAGVALKHYNDDVEKYWKRQKQILRCQSPDFRESCLKVEANFRYLAHLRKQETSQTQAEGKALCKDCNRFPSPITPHVASQIGALQQIADEAVAAEPMNADCREKSGVKRCFSRLPSGRPFARFLKSGSTTPKTCVVFFHGLRTQKPDMTESGLMDRFQFEKQISEASQDIAILAPIGAIPRYDLYDEFNSVASVENLIRTASQDTGLTCKEVVLNAHSNGYIPLKNIAESLAKCQPSKDSLCGKITRMHLFDGCYDYGAPGFRAWLLKDSRHKLYHQGFGERFQKCEKLAQTLGAARPQLINIQQPSANHFGPVARELEAGLQETD